MKNSTITAVTVALVLCPACGLNESTTIIKRHDADLSDYSPVRVPKQVAYPNALPCGFASPTLGEYEGTITDASADGGYRRFHGFDLVQRADGETFSVRFSVDGYRYDNIPVTCGSFSKIHGCGQDGTSYPTDGYQMYGSFVSATEARGYYADLYGCEVTKEHDFSVTLLPDAGR